MAQESGPIVVGGSKQTGAQTKAMVASSRLVKRLKARRVLRHGLVALALLTCVLGSLFCGVVVKVSCHEIHTRDNEAPLGNIEDVPHDWWGALAKKKILFVHREIGDEIVEGMQHVLRTHQDIALHIVEGVAPQVFEEPVLAHTKVGRCREPESKLEELKRILDSGVGEKVDIVFLQFCWADFLYESDAVKTFLAYQRMLGELEAEYPRVTFLHATVPLLMGKPINHKELIRESVKLLGCRPSHYDDDLRSKQYDDLLRAAYPRNRIFDLAFVEAVNPDGQVCWTTVRGIDDVLVRSSHYPHSNSHYSREEQDKIGEQLLIFLARVAADGTK